MPSPPAGWVGPIALETGTGSAIQCPQAWPSPDSNAAGGFDDTLVSPAGCAGCTCIGSAGVCPTTVNVTPHMQNSCTSAALMPDSVSTSCSPLESGTLAVSTTTAPTAFQASCAPTGAKLTSPPSFSQYGQACTGGTTSASCATGVCVKPATETCVYRVGAVMCPAAYAKRRLIDRKVDDQRACPCSCSTTPGACIPTVRFYGDSGCTTSLMDVGLGAGTCFSPSQAVSGAQIIDLGTAQPPSCGATGGPATGAAVGDDQVTVCCMN